MSFRPQVNDRLAINGVTYTIAEHPARRGCHMVRKAAQQLFTNYAGQLRNIQARYDQAVQELEARREIKVSYDLVLAGFAKILPCTEAP